MPIARFKQAVKPALLAPVALTLVALALSACYLPIKFDAEIEINRAGFYTMIFDGYVAQLELYRDLKDRKITPDEEVAKAQVIKTDFTRDSSVTEFGYYGNGLFKVHWEKKGDLLRHRMVTFLRRNEAMLSLKYVRDTKLITLSGRSMTQTQRRHILDSGLNMMGQLRVILDTKAKVVEHNADEVLPMKSRPGKTIYVWRIENIMKPTPRLVLSPG